MPWVNGCQWLMCMLHMPNKVAQPPTAHAMPALGMASQRFDYIF